MRVNKVRQQWLGVYGGGVQNFVSFAFWQVLQRGFSSLMGLCIHYMVYFSYFSGISDNTCPELDVVLIVKLGRWGCSMEILTIYELNYSVLDALK